MVQITNLVALTIYGLASRLFISGLEIAGQTPGGSSNTNTNNGNSSGAVGRKSVSAAMVLAAAAATAVFMA